tara:strand:- start:965 stop:1804 length:840 start_codon:yes stop_codon:yes gene_type:complete
VSSLFFTYKWKPGNQIIFGKVNMIDLAAGSKYSGSAGLDGFWSLGLGAPASGITPPYLLGAIANISGKKLNWSFMVYDPVSQVRKTGFESPFSKGVVLAVSPSWKINIGNSKGKHSIRLTYSTQDGENLYNLGDINPSTNFETSEKKYRYYASYGFNQPIKNINETKSWGLFGQIAFSDGNPNPIDFSFLFGLGGNSFIKNRENDKWGIGLYSYSLSSIIDERAALAGIPLKNEFGFETFYQYWINDWFSLGVNVQIIEPILKSSESEVFMGLRTSIKL